MSRRRSMLEAQESSRMAQSMASSMASPPAQMVSPGHQMVETAVDKAYERYETFLNQRQEAERRSRKYVEEQRYLSEQAEFLRAEENKRRMKEMQDYLKMQMKDKDKKRQGEVVAHRTTNPQTEPPSLPPHPDRNMHEEQYV